MDSSAGYGTAGRNITNIRNLVLNTVKPRYNTMKIQGQFLHRLMPAGVIGGCLPLTGECTIEFAENELRFSGPKSSGVFRWGLYLVGAALAMLPGLLEKAGMQDSWDYPSWIGFVIIGVALVTGKSGGGKVHEIAVPYSNLSGASLTTDSLFDGGSTLELDEKRLFFIFLRPKNKMCEFQPTNIEDAERAFEFLKGKQVEDIKFYVNAP